MRRDRDFKTIGELTRVINSAQGSYVTVVAVTVTNSASLDPFDGSPSNSFGGSTVTGKVTSEQRMSLRGILEWNPQLYDPLVSAGIPMGDLMLRIAPAWRPLLEGLSDDSYLEIQGAKYRMVGLKQTMVGNIPAEVLVSLTKIGTHS